MELIPVLSTIILVATITTFILAVGAYILYKKREKRERQYTSFRRDQVPAELITPAAMEERRNEERKLTESIAYSVKSAAGMRPAVRTAKGRSVQTVTKSTPDKFLKYTNEGYVPARQDDRRGSLKWQ